MKQILIAVLVLFGLVTAGIVGKMLFFPINTATKLIDTAYEAQSKTLNADNAIYNYEWFKQTNQDILAIRTQLSNASASSDTFKKEAGERKDWTFEDKQESARLESVKLGLQNNFEQVVANYNARASMANRNIFENNILPSYIDALTFIKK